MAAHSKAEKGGFSLALVQCFLGMFSFLPSGLVMYILCHYMWEPCHLLFDLDFTGGYS